ncbi:MAG: hypothetical protein KDB65_03050 [Calditrichaeota bacterium]|nr:hypothetical protein [Calditrichota bacterium]MCB9367898.1 hypothetical protein [Calditrichota bacterium]
MKWLVVLILTGMIAGCSWTPERSNPFDPNSSLYVAPPIPNRPPVISGLAINTSCVNLPIEDQCGVTVKARISDPDSNLRIGDINVTVNGRFFGRLGYYPQDTLWAMTLEESELDSAISKFTGSLVTLSVSDDSGATAEDTIRFPRPFKEYPSITWPLSSLDCICPDYRTLKWERWNGSGQARELEIRFYYQNLFYVSRLTMNGISPSDTTTLVDQDLFQPADSNALVFYGWRVFVVDELGNAAGSISGGFRSVQHCTSACVPPPG